MAPTGAEAAEAARGGCRLRTFSTWPPAVDGAPSSAHALMEATKKRATEL